MGTTGMRLKTLRQNRGWSQEELADILKLSKSAISKWERDVNYPQGRDIRALARLFNVSADYILGLTNNAAGEYSSDFEEVLSIFCSLNKENKEKCLLFLKQCQDSEN